jgi:hypothetical protein
MYFLRLIANNFDFLLTSDFLRSHVEVFLENHRETCSKPPHLPRSLLLTKYIPKCPTLSIILRLSSDDVTYSAYRRHWKFVQKFWSEVPKRRRF